MKNIDMAKIQKWVLVGVAVIAVFLLNLFMFINPQADELSKLDKQDKENTLTIQKLKNKQSTQEELQKEKKFFKFRLSELNDTLPNYVVPEKFVESLKNIIVDDSLHVEGVDFTKPVEYDLNGNKTTNGSSTAQNNSTQSGTVQPLSSKDLDNKADKLIDSIFNEDGLNATELKDLKDKTAKELQLNDVKDENAYKVDINFTFTGEYDQIKSFINKIETSTNKTTINSFTLETSTAGQKQGTIALSLYGFKDSKLPVYDLWSTDQTGGKNDLFSNTGSVTYDVSDSNMCDFRIRLSPITSDIPTVIISKQGSQGTEIYGDNKGLEKVDLYISEKGDKCYYRYSTQSTSWPANGSNIEFKPATLGDIIVKVFSASRVSDVDNSGMNLIVHNQTNRNINVVPYGDDATNPRLNVTITK